MSPSLRRPGVRSACASRSRRRSSMPRSPRPSGTSRSGPGSTASRREKARARGVHGSAGRVACWGQGPGAVVGGAGGPQAVREDAMDDLVQRAYRDAVVEHQILPLAQADVKVEQGEEGKPVIFTATVPVRPDIQLGDYRNFKFGPEIETN